ncbi:ABC transporter ATP-binding protein [Peptococcus niger]|uniref:ABC transporter transmembrane region n=1 Tax=Peptococcus niger TaxID=2741 RepID=A0A1G7A913_PEPNI|nr:ABC transporter ATP-binding protein [Peptococcus niger]SDE10977.1 ABC transporter transmembrane region [Peptococcus niger]
MVLIEIFGLYYTTVWKINSEFNVKRMFFKNIQNVLLGKLEKISDTSLYHRLFSDGSTIAEYFYTLSIVIPFNFFYVAFILFIMWKWSRALTIYSLVLIALEIINIKIAKKPILEVAEKQKEVDQNLVNYVMEKIELISFSQIMNMRDKSVNEVFKKFHKIKKITIKNFFYMSIFSEISSLIRQFWSLGLFIVGVNLIINNKITIGVFVGYQALLGYMMEPFSILINSLMSYQSNKVCFKRFIEYYELPKIDDSLDISFSFNNKIEICDISFSYEDKAIFKGFSENIEKGSFVVVSGKSGSGKTTLMKMLMKEIRATVGKITIDDIDINKINYNSYMDNFTFVQQKPIILNDSLRKNIVLDKSVEDEKLIDILEKLNLSELLHKLEYGLDTYIYDRKEKISSGEAQRINIARALLRNSKVIYFDEPTSFLDKKTELKVLSTIKKYARMYGITVIVNSHSKEVLKIADKVIYLNDWSDKNEK